MLGKKFYFLFALAGLLAFACQPAPVDQKKAAEPEVKEKVKLDFHVMSQCPYGVQVENAIKPVLDQIGKYMDFNIHFIGDVDASGNLTSMHGETEVKGNMIQLCSIKYEPQKYMNFLACMNKDMRGIPNNWEPCAKEAGLDAAKLKACYEGPEGKQLLTESFNKSKAVGARGSPTIFLAGEKYQGGRQADQFLRGICQKFTVEKPEPCKNIPEPKKLNLTVLTDKRCKECMPDRIVNQLKNNIFPGLIVKTLDYGDPEGKKVYDEVKGAGINLLPAFLFEKAVSEDPGYQQVQRFMKEAGAYQALQIGAKFDPAAEICDNQQDDTGDGG
ncbi:MAG: DsbA family protein, partial [Deltaproteobacteria bacterium]|nr:DsbA family protein [Deltaproteobacteria bacterium]